MSVYTRLQHLGLTLPPVAVPAAAYVPFVQTGRLVFLSGHIAKRDGQPWVGQLGLTMTTEEGQAAAARGRHRPAWARWRRPAAPRAPRSTACGRIVKVLSLVNSTPSYTEQHLVTNGCSALLGQVFGPEVGRATRAAAFGVAQLPLGACVEIELIAEAGLKP
jgi:enamine deaminase RidA (YjgF/YER057c/UK114 family)